MAASVANTEINCDKLNMTATVVSTVLNRENYKDWSFRMKTYFLAKDLWDIVEGTVKDPLEGEEHKAWKKKDAKALYAIQNSCGDDTYPLIKDETTAHEAWFSLSWTLEQYKQPVERPDENAEKPVGEAYPNMPESALEEVVTGGHDESVETVETLESNANHIQETFVKYVESNSWDNAINFLRQHPQTGRGSLDGTALHYAIRERCSGRILQQLVDLMPMEHLEILDTLDHSALYYLISWFPERVEVAECMVKKNSKLLTLLPSWWNKMALVVKAQGHTKGERMARYLYSLTPPDTIKVVDAAQLISDSFRLQRFDIAWDLIQHYPKLAIAIDHDKNIPLATLASNRFAFESGSPLGLWEKLIYYGIRIKPLPGIKKEKHESEHSDQGHLSDQKENQSHHLISSGIGLFRRLVANLQKLLGINRIYQMKFVHERIYQFLPLMCKAVKKEDMSDYQERKLKEALCVAAERGHMEYITHFLRSSSYPVLEVRNDKLQSLFQIAVECRQYNVYNLICEFFRKLDKDGLDRSKYGLLQSEGLKETVEHKDHLDNNMLHTVARITPLSQIDHIQGATLQMQRELQWFKEVESIADLKDCESVNKDNKTP